ncbi:HTH domain-containing protein [Desulfurobacterium atlanticum]|uniref:HTH domain-containing protein n=1 Tax=Desulfurobacterium atlanticum TaxID=240169 RepID=A0A239A6X0_9BACT|nr:HTH domain-containing protein [Desulfurobacterium atlanticum]SNR90633.1 HTH domain-containing protein [Desulfurobacterium atlanticum]
MRKLKHFKFFFFSTLRRAELLKKRWKKSVSSKESHFLVFNDYREFYRVFSPERIDILYFLRYKEGISISELAKGLNRNYKNVYNDVKILESFGFIKLEKKERKILIYPLVSTIEIKFFFTPDRQFEPPFFSLTIEELFADILKEEKDD